MRVVVCGPAGAGKSTLVARLVRASASAASAGVVEISRNDDEGAELAFACSTAQLLLLVLDASAGFDAHSRWQAYLAARLGVTRIVVGVNKLDCLDDPATALEGVQRDVSEFVRHTNLDPLAVVPIDALHGVNVVSPSPAMPWYTGPSLEECIGRLLPCASAVHEAADAISADAFEGVIVWIDRRLMLQSRTYVMECMTTRVGATVAPLKHKVHKQSLQPVPAKTLQRGEVGVCSLELASAIAFRRSGPADARRFALRDPVTNEVVGVGLLHFELRRSQNVRWQPLDVDKTARVALKRHRPGIVWFTGLSGAGKSTIANVVERELCGLGCHTYLLDGDNVRHGLNKDLGFTDADRVENIRRVAEVARLMIDAGLIVLVSFISPFRLERLMARSLVGEDEFIEVFVDVPLAVAEARDPKGLYLKARRGELKNFTGVDSPYEAPQRPEIRLDTATLTVDQAARIVFEHVRRTLIDPT